MGIAPYIMYSAMVSLHLDCVNTYESSTPKRRGILNDTKHDPRRLRFQTPSVSTHERCGFPRTGEDELVHGSPVSTAYPLV